MTSTFRHIALIGKYHTPAAGAPSATASAALQRIASDLPLDDQVLDYAVRLARSTRSWPGLTLGAGPRASIALVRCARARALLRGGEFVIPDDIKSCALAVLRHRVRIAPELDIEGLQVDQVLQQLLDQIPAPRL